MGGGTWNWRKDHQRLMLTSETVSPEETTRGITGQWADRGLRAQATRIRGAMPMALRRQPIPGGPSPDPLPDPSHRHSPAGAQRRKPRRPIRRRGPAPHPPHDDPHPSPRGRHSHAAPNARRDSQRMRPQARPGANTAPQALARRDAEVALRSGGAIFLQLTQKKRDWQDPIREAGIESRAEILSHAGRDESCGTAWVDTLGGGVTNGSNSSPCRTKRALLKTTRIEPALCRIAARIGFR